MALVFAHWCGAMQVGLPFSAPLGVATSVSLLRFLKVFAKSIERPESAV